MSEKETLHDIVFEGRNKAYGAYLLHSTSGRRIRISLLISIVVFVIIIALFQFGMMIIRLRQPLYQMPSVSIGLDNSLPTIFSTGLATPELIHTKSEVSAKNKTAPDFVKVSETTSEEIKESSTSSEESIEAKSGSSSPASTGAGVPWGSEEVFLVADVIPQFEGGREGLSKYLSLNVHYPEKAIDRALKGTVVVCFVVTSSGKVMEAKVVKGIDPLLDNEALRVVSGMPYWKPGLRSGKPVNIVLTLPIRFDLSLHFSR